MDKKPVPYENNPFMIGIEGLKLIFTNAKSVGIYAIVVTSVSFLLGILFYIISIIIDLVNDKPDTKNSSVEISTIDPVFAIGIGVLILLGILAYLAISLLLFGPLEHAAAMTAKGKQTTLKESFNATLRQFGPYLWLYILVTIKVLLWSLLFIIPGFIKMNRYILSGTVFFAEGKRGNAAIQRSNQLTKGAWLTTYAGTWIWNIFSQGLTMFVFWPGTMAVLYRQLSLKTDSREQKPPAHVLSWLTLLVPISLAVLYCIAMVLLFLVFATGMTAP